MQATDRSAATGFGFNPLDRASERRQDAAFIDSLRRDSNTRFLVFAGDLPVLRKLGEERYEALFSAAQLAELGTPAQEVFLGQDENRHAVFAVGLPDDLAEPLANRADLELPNLRAVAARGLFAPSLLGELGTAKSILFWHRRHTFCANCGAPSRPSSAGWRRDCAACQAQHFPRVDPVVIMVVVDGDRCLLGRQSRFVPGTYSALAGFLEPGETVEDAVRREVLEEAGIQCAHVRYFATQPWPFPAQLMIGCFARALNTDIVVDANELEDARWFTRAEVQSMFAGTHPQGLKPPMPFAIAHHLLKAFAEENLP